MIKYRSLFLFLSIIILSLTACAGANDNGEKESAQSAEKTHTQKITTKEKK